MSRSPVALRFHLSVYSLLVLALVPTGADAASAPAVEAVNNLGLSLLRQTEGNALVSPWSLQQALAIVYAGARGKTRDEMAEALGYGGDDAALHEGFRRLREAGDALSRVVEGTKPLHAAKQALRL